MNARALALLLVASAPGAVSCEPRAAEPLPIEELATTEGIDPEVVTLARRHASVARSRPTDAGLRANLALVYEANDLWNEAVNAWADALSLDPGQDVWRYHYAICLQRDGDYASALSELRSVVARSPSLPAARHRLGELLLEANELDGARKEFEEAIRLVDQAPDCYVGLAEVMLAQGDDARAAELCEKAIAIDPTSKRAHYGLGLAYRGLGRSAEAEAELNLGLNAGKKRYLSDPLTKQLDSYRAGYMTRLTGASTLHDQGKFREAAAILEKLLLAHPQDTVVLNNLAAAYLKLDRRDDVERLLDKALAIDPNQFATYLNLAAKALGEKDAAAALQHASKAVELAPNLGRAHFVLGNALLENGRAEEAYPEYQRASTLDAASGLAFGRLGEVALQLGRAEEAVGHYEKAVRLMPNSAPALAGLARALFRAGDREESLAVFERLRRLLPEDPEVRAMGRELGARTD